MDFGPLINIVAIVLSVIAVVVSSAIAMRQSRIMHNANLVPVITDVLTEFNSPDFKRELSYVLLDLRKECPTSTRFDDLPDGPRQHAVRIADYFYTVGALVATGVISEILVASFMGRSILGAWETLWPYIKNERERRDDDHFYMLFENLAALMLENPPERINKSLKLRRMPHPVGEVGYASAVTSAGPS
jgi:hypothetical protein